MSETAYDFGYLTAQLRVGDVRYVEQELKLHSGRGYQVRERVAILAIEPDPVQPDRMARVLGYSQATDGINGDPGYRSYPTRFGFGPLLRWEAGDDPDTISGQWWLGPNGLVGSYTPPQGMTLTEVVEAARAQLTAREELQTYRATHRHRRGGPEAKAARLAEEDAIASAAADRDEAIERLTMALRASDLPERRLAELSGLARATVRKTLGR